jgi:hypothetical protein
LVNTLRVLHGARAEEDPRSDLRVLPPITASRAICRSWAVRSSHVSTVRLRAVPPGAAVLCGALSERLHPDRVEQLAGRAQLLARVARRLSRRNHSL